MTSITLDVPDEILQRADFYSCALGGYPSRDAYIIKAICDMVNCDLDYYAELNTPFPKERLVYLDI